MDSESDARLELDPPRSPHELRGLEGSATSTVYAAGRLLLGAEARLVDAFASIPVVLLADQSVPDSALVVLEGQWDGRALGAARVLRWQPGSGPPLEWQRLFADGTGSRLRERAQLIARTRRFFEAEGFLEVDTPVRSAECGTETHVEPIASGDHYLVTSPELHMKRLLVGGVPRLFGLVRSFRAGEVGHLHSPEFLMLEWYRAFAGYSAVLEDTERLIHTLHRSLSASDELLLASGARVDLRLPFQRLTVRDAFARYAGVADAAELAARDEDEYFQRLVDDVEPALAELGRPVFLIDYPASQAALARLCPSDPAVAERFELYLGGVELCNGYGELTDPVEQRARCESDRARRAQLGRHVPHAPERFLRALAEGMPPASGNALGMDRLIMLLLGQPRIDGVMPFPSDQV